MNEDLLADAFAQLLRSHCTAQTVRAIEAGDRDKADRLWQEIVAAGYPDALLPEAQGGAGLGLRDVFALLLQCGAHALPLPLGETMVARAMLARAGARLPPGPLALASLRTPAETEGIAAVLLAAQMAGAMQRVLEMTLTYANERSQFGKPIGKFQAIQQQLAVMAEQVFAARMAAQMACATSAALPQPLLAALAKARASEAVPTVTAIAHAVHGAIGITAEYDLQLYTRRLHAWRLALGSELYWQRQIGVALLAGDDDFLPFIRAHLFAKETV